MTVGKLFVLSAPSGGGKTTLLKRVMADLRGLCFSISHTTRAPRSGERDGVDYHFVDRQEFKRLQKENSFLEWAEVHDNLYGTSRGAVQSQLAAGDDVIMDIDIQGAVQVGADTIDSVSIFISPPSLAELERRLRGRATDSEETILLRLANAAREMGAAAGYDYLIINDDLEQATDMLRAVILAERARGHRLASGELIDLDGRD
ncbi:MAG: guanylate kinase [Thermodesulfobacteriota bacterium]